MRPPHFRKRRQDVPATPASDAADASAGDESKEIVIRANMVFLGSTYPRRLRVVCFENPSESVAARLRAK